MSWNVSVGLLLTIMVGGLYGAATHQFLPALAVAALVWTAFLFGRKYGVEEQERAERARRAREEWHRRASRPRADEPEWVSVARRREREWRRTRELWQLPHEDRRN